MQRRSATLAICLTAACGCSLSTGTSVLAATGAVYRCVRTAARIDVDGRLDEPAWQTAGVLTFSLPPTNGPPASKTEGRLLWGRKHLYVAFKAYDEDIWGYHTDRDGCVYEDDALELFFKTDPNAEPYYNIEITPRGTVYDAFQIRRHAAGSHHRWKRWDCKGLKVGIHIEGTLNNWEAKDRFWQLEIAIPYRALPTLRENKTPTVGDRWKFHLARSDYSVYLRNAGGCELSSCALLRNVDFHRYEDWQPLEFVEAPDDGSR